MAIHAGFLPKYRQNALNSALMAWALKARHVHQGLEECSMVVLFFLPSKGSFLPPPHIRETCHGGRLRCLNIQLAFLAFLKQKLFVLLKGFFVPNIDTFAVPGIRIEVVNLAVFLVAQNLPLGKQLELLQLFRRIRYFPVKPT
jgi:hypothetical protein